jgi:hypothetical protein
MTKSEKELTRVKALRENRAAFNVLRNALASCDELSFAAYKLRNIRYALKRARGISSAHVYPHYTESATQFPLVTFCYNTL